MFIEMTEEAWGKLKEKMDAFGYQYEVSECTLPGEEIRHFHIDFGDLGEDKKREIAKMADESYAITAKESLEKQEFAKEQAAYKEFSKKMDEEYDRFAKEDIPKEERRREWDNKYHGVVGEAAGYLTGKSMEETVETR